MDFIRIVNALALSTGYCVTSSSCTASDSDAISAETARRADAQPTGIGDDARSALQRGHLLSSLEKESLDETIVPSPQ